MNLIFQMNRYRIMCTLLIYQLISTFNYIDRFVIKLKLQFLNQAFSECSASDGRSTLCDVIFVNLNKVSDVQVVKEANSPLPPAPRSLSVSRVRKQYHYCIILYNQF